MLDPVAPTIRYSFAELERLWIDAGGSSSSAPIAAAIATAESSGLSNNFNPSDPAGGSKGLWQINGVHWGGGDGNAFYDAQKNAQAAVALWKARGGNLVSFGDWSTFKSIDGAPPAYAGFLNYITTPAARAVGTQTTPATATAPPTDGRTRIDPDPLDNPAQRWIYEHTPVGGAIAKLDNTASWQSYLDTQIFSIGVASIGLALLAAGVAIAAASDPDVQTIAKAAAV